MRTTTRIITGTALAIAATALTACGTTTPAAEDSTPDRATPATEQHQGTTGQQQALIAAQSYVDTMPFSAKGLRTQLRFDKHTSADIDYAIKHVEVSWSTEAVEAVEAYLEQGMSKPGLVEQLRFDGYTQPQIDHGIQVAWK